METKQVATNQMADNRVAVQYYKSKIGELIFGSFEDKLCLLDFRYRKMRNTVDNRIKKILGAEFIEQSNDTISNAQSQLEEYLCGARKSFDVDILTLGTDFQKDVWKALINIPYGETTTYLAIAKEIDNEKAVRAVANANGANSLGIIIPCHRVIGSNGELVGYGGGVAVKKRLLKIEQGFC